MIGEQYWSTGIILKYSNLRNEWAASLKFFDDGFCDNESTEGKLHTRYFMNDLALAIDTLKEDAEKLGIKFNADHISGKPVLLAYKDGESKNWPMPENWRQILHEQAERIGWQSAYRLEETVAEND